MNKDNCRTVLIFSNNYLGAIVASMILTSMLFYFAEQAELAEGFANIGPALIFWLLAILNVIIALVCVSSILFRNKAIQYSWVLFYFTALFLYMFRSGPETIFIKHFNPDVRVRYANGMMERPVLLKMLNDEDKGVRLAAAHNIALKGAKQEVVNAVTNVFINIIEKDDDVSFRKGAAEYLGQINDPKGNDFLFNLFKSENQESREIAFAGIIELSRHTHDKYMEDIISALGDKSKNIREAAVRYVGNYYTFPYYAVPRGEEPTRLNRRIVEGLIPLLKDGYSDIRKSAAWTLGVSGSPLASEPLILALQDENPETILSVLSWVRIKDPRFIEFLLKFYHLNSTLKCNTQGVGRLQRG